jgi:glyoxylase-like metal-dependent hydrolase (beta-lactamase superfamily II)
MTFGLIQDDIERQEDRRAVSLEKVADPRVGHVPPVPVGVTEISRLVVRILAPNPSAMTLDGTNTYLVKAIEGQRAMLIDPGPEVLEHLGAISNEVYARQLDVKAVVTTHAHPDHAALAKMAASELRAPLIMAEEMPSSAVAQSLLESCGIDVIATPGHSHDSVSYISSDGVLMSGDHLLGRGTTAILHPDGSLRHYLNSLKVVDGVDFALIAPGHGPTMEAELGRQVIAYYRSHRLERIDQIRALIEGGATKATELTQAIYGRIEDPVVAWSARAGSYSSTTVSASSPDRVR